MDFYQGIFGSLANKMPTELAFFFENRGKYDANGTLGVAKNVWTGTHIPLKVGSINSLWQILNLFSRINCKLNRERSGLRDR